MKKNGDIVQFLKQKDYIMLNNSLGEGSFGKAVLLQDPFIDELFVAKKYKPQFQDIKEKFYKNFLDEIKIMYKLNHRNVVRIYNYYAYEDEYTGYILMEYIEGTDIGSFITNYSNFSSDVTIDDVFAQLIEGFQYIEDHGIIHRDIRESNILVDKTGTVKIIDFGIGKTFNVLEDNNDSVASKINREASDTLPQEYYAGVYTPQTDMFYLAELLNRLIEGAEKLNHVDFSYQTIIDKMMQKKPENRYCSFAEIKEAMDKHDFINMEISREDKDIYQSFTNGISQALSAFIDERKFNNDTEIFLSRIEKVYFDNQFEDVILNNADLLRSVVTGNYKYRNNIKLSCDTVMRFINWFKNTTKQSQQLILNSIISKLSLKHIEASKDDIPF